MRPTKLYAEIASLVQAIENCRAIIPDTEWEAKHTASIEQMVRDYMPSGAGVDTGTTFDFARSRPNRLVFCLSYHHMDENGYYDGWTDHEVIVTPDFAQGLNVRITGRDTNDIKDYLGDLYYEALTQDITK